MHEFQLLARLPIAVEISFLVFRVLNEGADGLYVMLYETREAKIEISNRESAKDPPISCTYPRNPASGKAVLHACETRTQYFRSRFFLSHFGVGFSAQLKMLRRRSAICTYCMYAIHRLFSGQTKKKARIEFSVFRFLRTVGGAYSCKTPIHLKANNPKVFFSFSSLGSSV